MSDTLDVLATLGFRQHYDVKGDPSIARLFHHQARCGIYVLFFQNGELYVGQAKDVTRRFLQHYKTYSSNIRGISFRIVSETNLSAVEREVIWSLEHAGLKLRNITFASTIKFNSEFDSIMNKEKQFQWITEMDYLDTEGLRQDYTELRRKFSRKYDLFKTMELAQDSTDVLREYVKTSIPAYKRCEVSHWSCSCLPATRAVNPDVRYYSRITIHLQEVFVAAFSNGNISFYWYLSRSILEDIFGEDFAELKDKYPEIIIRDYYWPSGGEDQMFIQIPGKDLALKLISDTDILYAVRNFNLRLIKKGRCNAGRFHCLDLADKIVV